jgi:protein-S-isoprenylcysteine O-methyltransferase Ste14
MKKKAKQAQLDKKVFLLLPVSVLLVGLLLFVPAGSLYFWQAWVFMFVLFVPAIFILAYFLKKDPEFLKRRMQYKEKERKQKTIVKLASLFLLIGFVFTGIDYRFNLSQAPVFLVIISNTIVFLSYLFVFLVFKENSYAARTVVVEKNQKVISTGPYSIVRHPMYTGIILMYLFIPLALGSLIALVFFIPTIPIIILRTLNEEEVLLKELKGYKEYTKKVKFRLLPGVW